MSRPQPHGVIDLDEEAPAQPVSSQSSAPSGPVPAEPVFKFDQAVFPRLASLMRKNIQKSQPIEVIDVNSPPVVPSSGPSVPLPLASMAEDGLQKQTREIITSDPSVPRITVVEDVVGLEVPNLAAMYTQRGQQILDRQTQAMKNAEAEEHEMEKLEKQGSIDAEEMVAQVPVQDLTEDNPPTKDLSPKSSLQQGEIRKELPMRAAILATTTQITDKGNISQTFVLARLNANPEGEREGDERESKHADAPVEVAAHSSQSQQLKSMAVEASDEPSSLSGLEFNPASLARHSASAPNSRQSSEISSEGMFPVSQEIPPSHIEATGNFNRENMSMYERPQIERKRAQIIEQIAPVSLEIVEEVQQNRSVPEQSHSSNDLLLVSEPAKEAVETQKQTPSLDFAFIRQKILKQAPNLTIDLDSLSNEEVKEMYYTVLSQLKVDLCQGQGKADEIPERISKQIQIVEDSPAENLNVVENTPQIVTKQLASMNIVESNLEHEVREVEVPAEGPIDVEGSLEKEGEMQAEGGQEKEGEMQVEGGQEKEGQMQAEVVIEEAKPVEVPEKQKICQVGIDEPLEIKYEPVIAEDEADVISQSQSFIEIDQDISISAPVEVENRSSPAKQRDIQLPEGAQDEINLSVEDVRVKIVERMSYLKDKIYSVGDEKIKRCLLIMQQAAAKKKSKNAGAQQMLGKVAVKSSEKELCIDAVISKAIELYPEFAGEIHNISQDKIREICIGVQREQSAEKNSSQPNGPETPIDLGQQEGNEVNEGNEEQLKPNTLTLKHSPTPPVCFKRTHEQMVETNEQKKPEEVESERKDRKMKEYSIDEIRTKLIAKLPQMETHIRKLNNKEVRLIFQESIQQQKKDAASKDNDITPEKAKGAVAAEDKKITHQVTNTRQSKANILNPSKMTDNVKVVETFDEKRKKKMRTVVLVHTEQDCSEKEMEGQSGSKMMRTENGVIKKCNCDLDINELLRRLGDLVQEKK